MQETSRAVPERLSYVPSEGEDVPRIESRSRNGTATDLFQETAQEIAEWLDLEGWPAMVDPATRWSKTAESVERLAHGSFFNGSREAAWAVGQFMLLANAPSVGEAIYYYTL